MNFQNIMDFEVKTEIEDVGTVHVEETVHVDCSFGK